MDVLVYFSASSDLHLGVGLVGRKRGGARQWRGGHVVRWWCRLQRLLRARVLGVQVPLQRDEQPQQACHVLHGIVGQALARVALALGVAQAQARRVGRALVRRVVLDQVDLVAGVGVVLLVARRLAAVAPAELERAAPAPPALLAGLARAYPDIALPPAIALWVAPVVVAAGEDGQQGQRLHALGRERGVQARAQRPARAALALGA